MSKNIESDTFLAFSGDKKIAQGTYHEVIKEVKAVEVSDQAVNILVFDAVTSNVIEVDFRGSLDDVLARLEPQLGTSILDQIDQIGLLNAPGPGRPKLGVVAREVTLLPRHWDWLGDQPGGASVALRKLVEQASRENADKDRVRKATESCYRFMSVMAGDLVGFEEASRALFAGKLDVLEILAGAWPKDIKEHVMELAEAAKS